MALITARGYLVIQYIGFIESEDSVTVSRLIKERGSYRTVGVGNGNDTLSKALFDALPIKVSLRKGASISIRDEDEYFGSAGTTKAATSALRCRIDAAINVTWHTEANVKKVVLLIVFEAG